MCQTEKGPQEKKYLFACETTFTLMSEVLFTKFYLKLSGSSFIISFLNKRSVILSNVFKRYLMFKCLSEFKVTKILKLT